MPRTDTASTVIAASPEQLYDALVDPDALVVWLAPRGMTARFEHFETRHVRRHQKGADVRPFLARYRRAGHHREDVGDAAIGDVALLAVKHVARPVGRRGGHRLHVGGIGANDDDSGWIGTPEPATIGLLLMGLGAVRARRRP